MPSEVNRQGFVAFMAFQCIPDNFTMFNNINKLPPAHMLIVQDGEITIKEYWQIKKIEIVLSTLGAKRVDGHKRPFTYL